MYGGVSGYTYPINEGTIKTGAEFLKRCIRSFGACAVFRDEPLDIPIEELIEKYLADNANSYYQDSYEKTKRSYHEFISLSNSEQRAELDKFRKEEIAREKEYLERMQKDFLVYEDIRNDVEQWIPPTDEHASIKEFALEQIDMCRPTYKDILESRTKLDELKESVKHLDEEFETWKQTKIQRYQSDLSYFEDKALKEQQRNADNLGYLKTFLNSLN